MWELGAANSLGEVSGKKLPMLPPTPDKCPWLLAAASAKSQPGCGLYILP